MAIARLLSFVLPRGPKPRPGSPLQTEPRLEILGYDRQHPPAPPVVARFFALPIRPAHYRSQTEIYILLLSYYIIDNLT